MASHLLKLTNLLAKAQNKGLVLTSRWFEEHGISRQLVYHYVKSGWLKKITNGAYVFSALVDNEVLWTDAVFTIQQQLNAGVVVGGKTALQAIGSMHFAPQYGFGETQLFGPKNFQPPKWLKSHVWKRNKFMVFRPKLFNKVDPLWDTEMMIADRKIRISTPEKAAIELCYLIPKHITFYEASRMIDSLTNMRPQILQSLLESCLSYKAIRLLLYFGEYFGHNWFPKLDLSRIEIGKGKRVIENGGSYHSKLMLSVPKLDEEM